MPVRKTCNIFFAVSGRGEFPLDMLRRDECEFLSERDKTVAETFHIEPGEPQRVVNIVMRNRDQYACPTTKRWESFGWKVSPIYTIDANLSEEEAQLEIQWARIQRAYSNMPGAWNLRAIGQLTGLQRLTAVAANMEEIAMEVREVYEELRKTHNERADLLRQRDAAREFFGIKKD